MTPHPPQGEVGCVLIVAGCVLMAIGILIFVPLIMGAWR